MNIIKPGVKTPPSSSENKQCKHLNLNHKGTFQSKEIQVSIAMSVSAHLPHIL